MKKTPAITLYYQLAEHLREHIGSGKLRPGDKLSSERDLSLQHGISRMTVRQALGQLEREGLLTVRSGVGTFVSAPKLTYDAVNLLGFTEAMLGKQGVLSAKVLSQKLVAASAQIRQALQLDTAQQVIEIKRIRQIDRIPMAIETNYLPGRFEGLESMNLREASLYAILEDLYNVKPYVAEQTIEAATTSHFEQKHFKVNSPISVLHIQGTSFDQYHQPVEFFKSSFRGDRFKVSVFSQRQDQPQTSLALILD